MRGVHKPLNKDKIRLAINRAVTHRFNMIKFIASILILVSFMANADEDFFSTFVSGNYLLIGQGIDTHKTYSGTVSIYLENKQLKVKRTINGNITNGVAHFKPTLNGDSNVLLIQFSDNDIDYEETCLWNSDLDNYARITCYLYIPGAEIKKPGMEALFIDHSLS